MRAAAIALVLMLTSAAPAWARPGGQAPSAPWRSVETAHVVLHFPEALAGFARPLAARVEAIHESVSAASGFVRTAEQPKIVILVVDPAAEANGMALPLRSTPRIVLWATAPESDSPIGRSRDWGELVALHELAHVAHLTRPPRNDNRFLRWILPTGPVARKAPRWVSEGYATLLEGRLSGSGRPNAAFRAALLRRWGSEGKLPPYGSLDGGPQWIAPSFAYLVGSAYLEWLELREGERSKGALVRVWKQMSGRRGLSFDAAFASVFGGSPEDLYARFVAETTTAAVEEERRIARLGAVEGTPWLRLAGTTGSLTVSADGSRVLAVHRSSGDAPSRLVVWSAEPSEAERKALLRREEAEKKRLEDPEEVADRTDPAAARTPLFEYVERNRERPRAARFLPDGRVLFVRSLVDPFGVIHADLAIWNPDTGEVRGLTRFADLHRPDPDPTGRFALAIRKRDGRSELVRVDLAEGAVVPVAAPLDPAEPLDAPRLSPDGKVVVVARQRNGRWELLSGDVAPGSDLRVVDLGGAEVAGPPVWSRDGARLFATLERDGNWGIEAISRDELASGRAAPRRLTRSLSALHEPAAFPDGSLLLLQLASKGQQIRKLPPAAAGAADLPPLGSEPRAGFPVWPTPPAEVPARPVAAEVAERPYSPLRESRWRFGGGSRFTVSGLRAEPMLTAGDPVGVFDAALAFGLGERGETTGGAAAVAYHGLRAADLRGRVYALREQPSERSRDPEDADRDRLGAELFVERLRYVGNGRVRLFAGALVEREKPKTEDAATAVLAGGGGEFSKRHRVGDWGARASAGLAGFTLDAGASGGRTSLGRFRLELAALLPDAEVELSGELLRASRGAGATAGGASGSLEPELEDETRIAHPALVPGALTGRSVTSLGVSYRNGPVSLFAAELRSDAPEKRIRLAGAEGAIELDASDLVDLGGRIRLSIGAAAVENGEGGPRRAAGWFALTIRP